MGGQRLLCTHVTAQAPGVRRPTVFWEQEMSCWPRTGVTVRFVTPYPPCAGWGWALTGTPRV